MSAERVREFYRKQGEERQRAVMVEQLKEIAEKWEARGFIKSAQALRTAVIEMPNLKPEIVIDQAHHEAWTAGKKFERERIIQLIQNHSGAASNLALIALIRGETE
jgi:hypothetical protein